VEHDLELDTRGLLCPLPILKARAALNTMQPGQVLKVLSSDPGSVRDMEAFAKLTRNPLLYSRVDGTDHVYFLRKSGVAAR
jgi:tRNA 2-thiouridine synthesizing protein A